MFLNTVPMLSLIGPILTLFHGDKNGKSRLCGNLREVNKAKKKNPYTVAEIRSTIISITNANLYSEKELSYAYFSVDSETQRVLGFILSFGLYNFLRAAFRVTGPSSKI